MQTTTLALRRRSIRTLTTDELRGVHGGNTSPAPATTNGQTGSNRESGTTITTGTTIIRQSPSGGTSIIKQISVKPN
ncbi:MULTISPECIES: hypothetical protein [unclassified Mycobacterium]|uniref:hypothetical protein n=1 Tax=unclassified Mycobacterium TaxID=2642494 RepID=UPI0029C8D891|nr:MULTISPECIES: hypothetical protein [unclassified Mycobacterium]